MRLKKCSRSSDQRSMIAASSRALSISTTNLQVMIFGSSTDVGKTVVAAGICRAALSRSRKVCYIKPVQTGELDEYFVSLYTNPQGICDMFLRTLHHWSSSMSPHLASRVNANWQCLSAFDFQQRAGHHDEIAGQVEIQELQRRQVPLKLRGDFGDRQVDQIQFVPPDQEQQQVQRPGKKIKFNSVIDGHGGTVAARRSSSNLVRSLRTIPLLSGL